MVFYRKYRPQTFAELVGQDHIKQPLRKAIAQGSLGHAYLFCGPKGSGKTSTARILAKAVNCEQLAKKAGSDPCNQCSSCLAIAEGSHMDVLEIDAASNRGIDDIRSLQEKIMLAPVQGRKKVYIIDEVHMLTNEAFNALLKTLEEPPEHVLLILATTEIQKVLPTIVSRCQRFDFHLATSDQLVEALQKVITAEHITIEDDALALLIERSEGSYRDAEKLLDQLASSEPITLASVEAVLHGSYQQQAVQLLEYLARQQQTEALAGIAAMTEQGVAMPMLYSSLLGVLRTISYVQVGLTTAPNAAVAAMAEILSRQQVFALLKLVSQAERESRGSSLPALALELAVLEWTMAQSPEKPQAVSGAQKREEVTLQPTPSKPKPAPNRTAKPVIAPLEAGAMIAESSDNIVQADPDPVALGNAVAAVQPNQSQEAIRSESSDVSFALVQEKWPAVITQAAQDNPSVALLLKNATIHAVEGDTVTLEVYYKFHKERLENDRNRRVAEHVLSSLVGQPVQVRCVFFQKAKSRSVQEEADDLGDVAMQIFSAE